MSASFPADELYRALEIQPSLNEDELNRILEYQYQGRYTNLVLSLLYPDRDWKDAVFHEDHIFPQSEFKRHLLENRGYGEDKIRRYISSFNTLPNLQLLTESENTSKSATPFHEWLETRDTTFCSRHHIPKLPNYDFDFFEEFSRARKKLIIGALKRLP